MLTSALFNFARGCCTSKVCASLSQAVCLSVPLSLSLFYSLTCQLSLSLFFSSTACATPCANLLDCVLTYLWLAADLNGKMEALVAVCVRGGEGVLACVRVCAKDVSMCEMWHSLLMLCKTRELSKRFRVWETYRKPMKIIFKINNN